MRISFPAGFTVLFVLLTSCQTNSVDNCNCCLTECEYPAEKNHRVDSAVIDISHVGDQVRRSGLSLNFGLHFLQRDSNNFLVMLNSAADSLIAVNLFGDRHTTISSVKNLINKTPTYSVTLQGDTLHLFHTRQRNYIQFVCDSSFNFRKVKDVDLSACIEKKAYINSNIIINNKIAFRFPYLYVPYGMYDKKGEMDKMSTYKINISNLNTEEIIPFPERYSSCGLRSKYPILQVFDGKLTYVFLKDDRITIMDQSTDEVLHQTDTVVFTNRFMCFDKSAEADLAYSSKYDINDEENHQLIKNNNRIYLIKRLRKGRKQDPTRCVILIYDLSLTYISAFYPQAEIFPRLSFGYKNGVALFSEKWDKIYYYDLSAF